MFGNFLRGFGGLDHSANATKTRTLYHWNCECGAHSREGDSLESHAEYKAQRHQWGMGVEHPMPAVYSADVDIPADWPD